MFYIPDVRKMIFFGLLIFFPIISTIVAIANSGFTIGMILVSIIMIPLAYHAACVLALRNSYNLLIVLGVASLLLLALLMGAMHGTGEALGLFFGYLMWIFVVGTFVSLFAKKR